MVSYGLSEQGPYRAENQDAFRISPEGIGVLAVVCDGMGGAAGGRLASDMAAESFISFSSISLELSDGSEDADILRLAVTAANRKIYEFAYDSEEYAGMGTTLVGGVFRPDRALLVNVGDSRAYRIARDGITRLTRDHSLVQQMVDAGELTPEQARRHPRRNIITRAVGTEPFVTSDIFEVPAREGDVFLLCSDGLTGAVEDPELHRLTLAAPDAESACRALIDTALSRGTRDNATAVVIIYGKENADNGE